MTIQTKDVLDTPEIRRHTQRVRAGGGKLSIAAKSAMLDAIEALREVVLRWPAWVTPQKGRRLTAQT